MACSGLAGIVGCSSDDFTPVQPKRSTVTVVLAGTGTGTVTSGDGKINCGTTCSVVLEHPPDGTAPITLTAAPAASARFTGWTGGCTKDPLCRLDVNKDVTLVANFEPKVALTVDFKLDADATSTLTSAPAGISLTASGTTTTYFDPGTQVTLSLTPPAGGEVFRFGGACTGTNGRPGGTNCVVTLDAAKTVTVRVAHYNYAFLTSTKSDGNLGGLTGADTNCNTLATAAGLPGNFVAFLSTETIDAKSRLGTADGWRRSDGVRFIDDKADLFGPGAPKSALDTDETGKPASPFDEAFERTFTGSNADGTTLKYANNDHCKDWTAPSGQVSQGAAPINGRVWMTAGAAPCSASARFMCLGTDLVRPLPAATAPPGARKAFVSVATVTASDGLVAFDQLCKTEASQGGLPNSNSFLALVAPSNGVSAASRFDLNKGPWVGVDNVLLAPDAKSLMEKYAWIGGVHRQSGGTVEVAPRLVLTGYRKTSTLAAPRPTDPGNYTCAGWTSTDAGTRLGFGQTGFTGSYAMSFLEPDVTINCSTSVRLRVYCLEN